MTDREADCCVKGQNAFNQLQHAVEKWAKKNKGASSVHSPRATNSPLEAGPERQDETENSPKGWSDLRLGPISRRKLSFRPLLTSRQQERITPLSVRLVLLSLIATSFSPALARARTHTHTANFNSSANKLHSCVSSFFCSCHLFVRLSAHICRGRTTGSYQQTVLEEHKY